MQAYYSTFDSLGKNPEEQKNEGTYDTYSVTEVENSAHKQALFRDNYLVCVDIYSTWCQPCKMSAPAYANLAQKYDIPGKCILVKELYDKKLTTPVPGALPSYYFYVNGRKVAEEVVGPDMEKIEAVLKRYLNGTTLPGKGGYSYMPQDSQFASQGPSASKSSIRNSKPAQINYNSF